MNTNTEQKQQKVCLIHYLWFNCCAKKSLKCCALSRNWKCAKIKVCFCFFGDKSCESLLKMLRGSFKEPSTPKASGLAHLMTALHQNAAAVVNSRTQLNGPDQVRSDHFDFSQQISQLESRNLKTEHDYVQTTFRSEWFR